MSISSSQLVIGVAGTFSSGQDSFCRYLEDAHRFMFISTSDMVREAAVARYGSVERPTLQRTGLELRLEHGGGVFVDRALLHFRKNSDAKHQGVVIGGIRSLGEMQAIKKAGGQMVFIDAPIELRYERMKSRGRDAEIHTSLEEFRKREAHEAGSGTGDADFNRDKIKQLADYLIINDSSYEHFIQAIDIELAPLLKKI